MNIKKNNKTKTSMFVRGLFVLFLITTLFAPTSLIVTPQLATLDSVTNVKADDEEYFNFGNVDTSIDLSGEGVGGNIFPAQMEIAPPPITLPSYDDYMDYAGSYNNTTANTSFWGDNIGGGDTSSDNGSNFYGPNTMWGEDIGGGNNVVTTSNIQPVSTSDIGGGDNTNGIDIGGGNNTNGIDIGGGDNTTGVDIGGGTQEDAFPWWVALLAIPLIHNSNNSDASVPPAVIVPPGTTTPTSTPCVAVTVASTASANGVVGTAFSYTISGSGTAPITFTAGSLPPGLTFSGATISGTPTTAGTYTVTITATNACGSATQTLTIVIVPVGGVCIPGVPVITSGTSANVVVDTPFTYTITATNNPTSFAASSLPAGLSVSTSTGVISGTVSTIGSYVLNFSATNNCGTGTGALSLSVNSGSGGGGGGGGGGSPVPNVTVTSSGGGVNPSVYLASTPYAGLYLNQLPYTGIGDMIVAILFVLALLLVSMTLAYVSVYGQDFAPLRAFTAKYVLILSVLRKKFTGKVQTLAREREIVVSSLQAPEVVLPLVTAIPTNILEKLVAYARREGALLKEDAAELIYNIAEGDSAVAHSLLTSAILVMKSELAEDMVAILTLAKVKKLLADTYCSLASSYVDLLIRKEEKKAQNFLMKLHMLEADVYAFLLAVGRIKEEKELSSKVLVPVFA